ncbi:MULTISPECIES: hypothetical protein [Bifidobacterium]|uniref:Uncharacterized protein n=2 Tax=Bifidobacterium TaxID=1678 RepID=A0A2M9HQB3_9BIFI|nr:MULTISPECIES: hypothetical protein [Bifidobacterium]KAA8818522.1 hypothetical protein CSQ85_08480 [Bifidobacterium rousetti]KFI50764.1 hypothetical protein BBIA_1557 [Bifidobacterium biavatii DSM 23969]PJM78992.1 hypothetical protein CUU80_06520 [Bifidobacterium scaligerum]
MNNRDPKRNLIIIVTVALIPVILLGAACLRTLMPARHTVAPIVVRNDQNRTVEPKSDTTVNGQRIDVYRTDEACVLMAPLAVQAYVSDRDDRDRNLSDLFTEDAEGLQIPVERIRHDDAGSLGNGYVKVAINDDAAACVVETESGVIWEVYYADFDRDGYKASKIISHDRERAYVPDTDAL